MNREATETTLRAAPPAQAPVWLAAIPVFLPLAMYVYTVAPGVTLTDSGEFVMAIRTLGVAHPPGVPTYVLLGNLFSRLPLAADMARRTNLFSAMCAALAAGFSYLLTRQLLRDLDPRLALAGALAFGFSLSLWSWAVVTEVYALNILLVTLTLWLAARGDWIAGCFTAGLALGVHHATVLMTLPPAFYLAWTRRRPTRRQLALATVAGLLGLSLYLFLPWRAAQHPILNWGDPQTLERFWWHVSGKQYRDSLLASARWRDRVELFLSLWMHQITAIGLAVAGVGFVALWRRNAHVFWFTVGVIGLNAGFVIANALGGPDIAGYYLPAFLTLTWCFALGAETIVLWLGQRWAIALVFAAAFLPAMTNFQANDHRRDRLATLYVENSLRDVPPGSLVLTGDWQFYSPWMCLHFVDGQRPDLTVINTNFVRRSWGLSMLEQEYPGLYQAAHAEIAAFRIPLDQFEHGQPYINVELESAFNAVVKKLIRTRLDAGAAVFITRKLNFPAEQPYAVHGLLYQYAANATEVPLDLSGLIGGVPLGESGEEVRKTYAAMIAERGTSLYRAGEYAAARAKLDLAMQLDADQPAAARLKGLLPR
jgi:hypothetical protein